MPATGALLGSHSDEHQVEIEASLRQLWAPANRISS
jgi:hypothetical protein